jgi:hypothetical protein
MTVMISPGLQNKLAANNSMKGILEPFIVNVYGGSTIPATAGAAELGTKLLTLTNASATAKVAQIMHVTPATAGTTGTWSVTVNGDQVTFTDDTTPTVKEVVEGLKAALDALVGGAVTTPACTIQTAKCHDKFTVTEDDTKLVITSASAGVPITVTSTCTGAGNTLTTTTSVADAYGLMFEAEGDVASGILELLSTMTASGTGLAAGTALYARVVGIDDTGVLSTTEPRIQCSVGTANADLILDTVSIKVSRTVTASSLSFTFPAS